jgi:hypothetical protein
VFRGAMGGSMYVRVKRGDQTVFLHCQGSESLRSIKARTGEVLGVSADDMKLFAGDKELNDDTTIGGAEIKNDAVIVWVKRTEGESQCACLVACGLAPALARTTN